MCEMPFSRATSLCYRGGVRRRKGKGKVVAFGDEGPDFCHDATGLYIGVGAPKYIGLGLSFSSTTRADVQICYLYSLIRSIAAHERGVQVACFTAVFQHFSLIVLVSKASLRLSYAFEKD